VEQGRIALHVRRRLSPKEQVDVGIPRDVRCTLEGIERAKRVADFVPWALEEARESPPNPVT